MYQLFEQLKADAPVITDGAWGTQLQALGLPAGASPDEWNLSHPDKVRQVAASYVEAGSQIILTNTFQANRYALEKSGLADKTAEINRAGVRISREAAGEKARVFASIGPSGKLLFMGQVSESELLQTYREQAQAIASESPDAIVIETMSDLAEAKLALAAAKETGLPVVACMVFDAGKNKDRTMTGVTPEQAVEELAAAGADAVGANCGTGIEAYIAVCKRMAEATNLPVWIKPNAGTPEIEAGKIVYRTSPEHFAEQAKQLVAGGATFIGGCCGTNPDFIRRLRQTLKS